MSAWAVKDAVRSSEEVFTCAWKGEPQIIMRDDVPMVVVVSFSDYQRHASPVARPKKRSAHDLIGYGRKYGGAPRTAEDWLREIREGDAT